MKTIKDDLIAFKERAKKKHGTLRKFAIAIGMDDAQFRKLIARINHNTGKYITVFDARHELEKLNQLLNKS